VWPDSFVEEGNLKVTVFMLRRALEEDPAAPRYVLTVPRRGYRFAADVSEGDERGGSDTRGPSPRGGVSPINSIAVLPFKLLAGVGEEEYLGLGLTDALVVRLSQLRRVTVRPTSSVRRYARADQDPVAAGRELRVEAVLDGNVHRAADRVRVTAQLIRVETEEPLWAGKFDAPFTDIFAVEDSISERVAEALAPELTGEDRRRLARRHTENVAAYQLYLKGRYHWAKRTSEGIGKAGEHFRAAIDLDALYAPAYTGLADCYAQLGWMRLLRPADAFPAARAAALRALELDGSRVEAHVSLAWARMVYDWDWAEAEGGFVRALEIDPNYSVARMWYGVFLVAVGRFEEAAAEVRRAQELDPLSPVVNAVAGWPYYFMRRHGEAAERYRRALEVEPNSLPAHYLLGCACAQAGEGAAAVAEFKAANALDDSTFTLAGLGRGYAAARRGPEAGAVLEELSRRAASRYVSPYDLALIRLSLGEREHALRLLEEACEDRSAWLIFLSVEPAFDPLRAERRFAALLGRTGLG
jgi:TolB-like protein/Tfp pilus assembly protein PilF